MQYYSMLEYLMMKRSRRSINLILQDFYHSMVGSTEIVGRNTLNYPPTAAPTHWQRICRSLHLRCGILALVDSLLPENNAWQSPPEESPVVFLCITTGITCWCTPPEKVFFVPPCSSVLHVPLECSVLGTGVERCDVADAVYKALLTSEPACIPNPTQFLRGYDQDQDGERIFRQPRPVHQFCMVFHSMQCMRQYRP